MNVTRVAIYNYIYNAITAAMPDVYVAARYEPVPASLPAVFIREMRAISERDNMTFSGVQGVYTVTMEVQIITHSMDSPLTQCEAIEKVVEDAFKALFFIRTYSNVISDGQNGFYRLRITYQRTIGDADEMPPEEEDEDEEEEEETTEETPVEEETNGDGEEDDESESP